MFSLCLPFVFLPRSRSLVRPYPTIADLAVAKRYLSDFSHPELLLILICGTGPRRRVIMLLRSCGFTSESAAAHGAARCRNIHSRVA